MDQPAWILALALFCLTIFLWARWYHKRFWLDRRERTRAAMEYAAELLDELAQKCKECIQRDGFVPRRHIEQAMLIGRSLACHRINFILCSSEEGYRKLAGELESQLARLTDLPPLTAADLDEAELEVKKQRQNLEQEFAKRQAVLDGQLERIAAARAKLN